MDQDDRPTPAVPLWRGSFDAVVFDLDGVLTRTARVHAAAWKETFDEHLERRAAQRGEPFHPFDADADYRMYVDGRPRDEGAATFLESRRIRLPHGTPEDHPDRETVWGLGNRKRDRFLALVRAGGVEVDAHAVALTRDLRNARIATAVVSSSRNGRVILDATGLSSLFDIVLDGNERARLGLPGKPAPDMFLEAARQLGVAPLRAVVIEDAAVGVTAGRRGGFGCVVGVDRGHEATALRLAGAHVTVCDLAEIVMTEEPLESLRPSALLPSALDRLEELTATLGDRRLAVFLDYDGTLTPIVPRPEDARLSEQTRDVLRALARAVPVTIISGRDLRDVRQLVAVDDVVYAGSHGFEIVAPDGTRLDAGPGEGCVPALDHAERALRQALAAVPGATVERKRFTIAVHFRRVAEIDAPRVAAVVQDVAGAHAELRRTEGKKVFELQPDIDWNKGAALRHVMRALGLAPAQSLPVYIGDDLTDEDAFRAIARDGLPVVVRDEPRPTFAHYALDDVAAVRRFLEALRASAGGESRS